MHQAQVYKDEEVKVYDVSALHLQSERRTGNKEKMWHNGLYVKLNRASLCI
jgi:hypothetical protein